jgi:hypothetical protein
MPVDSQAESNSRKPYKEKPQEKPIYRSIIIILLILSILVIFIYIYYQGTGSGGSYPEDTVSRKKVNAKDNIAGKKTDDKNPVSQPAPAAANPNDIKIKEVKSKQVYSLRNVYHTLSKIDVESIIKRYGFCDNKYNSPGQFENDFEKIDINGNPVIIDHKTGLMWHPGGSDKGVEQKRIPRWLKDLNSKKYAGFNDWRLPTLEEAASLLKNSQNKAGLYIDPFFSPNQKHIWTGDKFETNNLWLVLFNTGTVLSSEDVATHFIRPVRPM